MRYSTDAIVLRATPFSESSQVVQLLTAKDGQVRALARGAYRLKSGFGGPLDVATRGVADLGRRRAGGLDLLYGFVLSHPYRGLRADLPRWSLACYLMEVSRLLSWPRDRERALFPVLAATLDAMEAAADPIVAETWALACVARALSLAGLAPRTGDCAACGSGRTSEAWLSPATGGVLCHSCAGRDRTAVPVGARGADLLERLLHGAGRGGRPPEASDVRAVRNALERFVEYRAEGPLGSRRLVDRFLVPAGEERGSAG